MLRGHRHPLASVERSDVETTGELRDVAVEVLVAELVVGPVVAALEQHPERIDAADVGLLVDVLADGVVDRFVPARQSDVGLEIVGVGGRGLLGLVGDKRYQVDLPNTRNYRR